MALGSNGFFGEFAVVDCVCSALGFSGGGTIAGAGATGAPLGTGSTVKEPV